MLIISWTPETFVSIAQNYWEVVVGMCQIKTSAKEGKHDPESASDHSQPMLDPRSTHAAMNFRAHEYTSITIPGLCWIMKTDKCRRCVRQNNLILDFVKLR